jgi:hypothetical protein
VERFLHCHRAQINSLEFLNGVRTVLKRDNVVEALAICDATHGPVARLVKTAILESRPRPSERCARRRWKPDWGSAPARRKLTCLLRSRNSRLCRLLGTVWFHTTFADASRLHAHVG